jgi:hypothetical protein
MKKWIAVLIMVLGAATPSVIGQEVIPRGTFEPPLRLPPNPDLTPAPRATSQPPQATRALPAAMPLVDSLADSKGPGKPTDQTPLPVKPMPPVPVPAACACSGSHSTCATCQVPCQRSCCDKLKAWFCHHRENTPDCCYVGGQPVAHLYTWFLDYPCIQGSITVPTVPTTCDCKRPCPFQYGCFGQLLGNGNLSCH